MIEEQPTMSVRVDYALTSAQMADALLNSIFGPDGHPHTLSPEQTMTVVRSFLPQETQRSVRTQLMWYGQHANHWRDECGGPRWDAQELHEVHTATVVHVERLFPGMVRWQTYETHPASGLKLELFPLHAPRWAQVTTEYADGTSTQHTRTSDVDSAYRAYSRLYREYVDMYTDDEN